MPFGGLLTVGLIGAGSSIFSGLLGKSAANKAADQQTQAQQNAIAEQQREFNIAQGNSAPFVSAGQSSIAQLMEALKSGKFGVGSTGNIPTDFKAPTLEEAQNTPGYQFAAQQGSKGVLQGAAAAGGAISGGTLKALDSFNSGLANSTYGDVFNRALSGYQASLAGYGTKLAGQQQEFNQLFAPAQLGAGAASSINATGSTAATNIAQLMAGIGTSQAGGTLGGANSIAGGINGATNGILQAVTLGNLFKGGKAPPATALGPANVTYPYGTNSTSFIPDYQLTPG